MKKLLLFLALPLFAVPSYAQSIMPHAGNSTQGIVCLLNLQHNLPDVDNQCSVAYGDLVVPTIVDGCGATVVPTTDSSIFPVNTPGTTTITWTYNNGSMTDTQTQDIKIFDFTEPVADLPVLQDITGQCRVLESELIFPTATDNCGGFVTVTHDGVFPITAQGATTITWSYKDAGGNTTTQTQNIVLFDYTEPVADAAVLNDIVAECQLLEADITFPTATDNCGGVVTVTNNGIFPITADTTITWTYTDVNGNSNTQSQDVLIYDFTEPVPDTVFLSDISAPCQVLEADVPVPTATDNCGGAVTVSHNVTFPITRSTQITWSYTDARGNVGAQLQNIIITDATAPIAAITILPVVARQCPVNAVDLTVPTATDNCGGIITVTNDGVFPIAASTTITWTYTDANGNSMTQTQDIVINDTTAPVADISVLADITAQCEVLQAQVVLPGVTDNCGGPVTVTSDAVYPISSNTTITWTYADANGNTTTQTQNVVLNDTTAPVADVAVLADLTAQCQVVATDVTAPTATDNCGGLVTIANNAVFPITASGLITWTYTDTNGNVSTQSQNVIINDTTAPVMTLTDVTVSVDVTGNVTITAEQLENGTSSDNCGIASLSVTPNAFDCSALGNNVVTVTLTDIHGNTNTGTAIVTVNDPSNFCGALGTTQPLTTKLAVYPNPTTGTVYIAPGQYWDSAVNPFVFVVRSDDFTGS